MSLDAAPEFDCHFKFLWQWAELLWDPAIVVDIYIELYPVGKEKI